MKCPRLSVVIAAYNAAPYLSATLTSVLAQEFEGFEVIVVDDGSTDATPGVIRSFDDPRLRAFRIDNSGGAARPRNHGIRAARSDTICFFDADDVMLPGKLSHSYESLQLAPSAGVLFTNFQSIDSVGDVLNANFLARYDTLYDLPRQPLADRAYTIAGEHLLAGLGRANYIGTSSVLVRKAVIVSVGGFDEQIKYGEDFDLWARLFRRYDGVFVDEVLHQYRVHGSSLSMCQSTRRNKMLVQLHERHWRDPDLPKAFVTRSRRRAGACAIEVAKESIRAGDAVSARVYAKKAVALLPWRYEGYGLYALSVISQARPNSTAEVKPGERPKAR